jgi:hypothetical protein
MSQHHTSNMLLFITSLLHAVHISSGYLDLFYTQCTDQITVRSVACNKFGCQEGSFSDVIRSVSSEICNNNQNICRSVWYLKSGLSELKSCVTQRRSCVAVLT